MWSRLIVSPWWVRWIVPAAFVAVFTAAIWAFAGPNIASPLGWPWRIAVSVCFGFVAAAAVLVIHRPAQRAYAAALNGLGGSQRLQAKRALRRGDVPADPAVLAAAIRVGTLSAAYRRTASPLQKALPWLLSLLYIVLAVVAIYAQDMSLAVIWLVCALLFAASAVWTRFTTRRLSERLLLLRYAATTQDVSTEDEALVEPPKPPAWHRVAAVLVLIVATTGLGYAMGRPRADCRTVDRVVGFIADHRDMLDAQLITPGGPSLDDYQSWSNQLGRYSTEASAPDLAPHLRRIADLSTQAVALVSYVRTRTDGVPAETVQRQFAYQDVITQMISEEEAANDICHPR